MIHIREAEKPDYQEIIRLMKNELGYPDLDEVETDKRLDYFKNSDDFMTFVAVVDDEIAGFIDVMKGIAYTNNGYYSQIMALAVSEKKRRCGIGTALVTRAEEWSLSYGIAGISVNSNIMRLDAHAFYEKLGYTKKSFSFKKIQIEQYENGESTWA